MAWRRSWMAALRLRGIGSAPPRPRGGYPGRGNLPRSATRHEAGRPHRLLGPRPDPRGPARGRPGGRAARLRLRVDRGGLRLRRGDDPRLDRRADDEDQDRLRGPPQGPGPPPPTGADPP